ncbi:MAG: DNA translocase FtsK 4TM domain-containing protein [Desulfobacterales bacterium]|nr:DNA translocase FtsK 4TM domain-containing protein [Desulfobacterales bacterium]MBF0395513.1 DNA translocase FtsK 4TM domain-containing protein [Desulfobacterales bacterium]
MRKEVLCIFLFFLILFTSISLFSYSPYDLLEKNQNIHNMFGIFGAYFSGSLVAVFGIAAFLIPILLFFLTIRISKNVSIKNITILSIGAILILITTGSLFALKKNNYIIFGITLSSGGIIGIGFKSFLIKYVNTIGSSIILTLLWLMGFIFITGFSILSFLNYSAVIISSFFKKEEEPIIVEKPIIVEEIKKKQPQAKKRSKEEDTVENKEKEEPIIQIKKFEPKQLEYNPIIKNNVPKSQTDTIEIGPPQKGFQKPPLSLLKDPEKSEHPVDDEYLKAQSRLLESKLEDFGVKGKVVAISPGPVITTFEYEPAPGVKINKIVNLTDDLTLALKALSIRIVAPIPGKAVVGIEVPNVHRESVFLKEIIASSAFEKSKSELTLCLGKDIIGNPITAELDKMPHLLIAGATGAGKSVGLNGIICSLLYKSTPDEVRFIMVDPKRIELSMYEGIPYLITPVVTDAKKATNALFWAVKEMERRYELLSEKKVKNVKQYNQKIQKELPKEPPKESDEEKEVLEKLPYIVIIIDELADLMMVSSRDVELALTRLAQMARAAGIHLILATQRPSVDVITGIIKANFPTRLTYQVSSKIDSRTIIDTMGAERLLGNGDMLFLPPGTAKLKRIQGAYVSEDELVSIVEFLKEQKAPEYLAEVTEAVEEEKDSENKEEYDEKYDEAVALVTKTRQASISMLQRYLGIGYNRAAKIIEVMEREGVVGPSDGVKKREVLVRGYED